MTRTFVVCNNKGGVGKSTVSSNICAVLSRLHKDKSILYVDLTLTKSISTILLGDAPVKSMSTVLSQLGEVRSRRRIARSVGFYSIPAISAAIYLLPLEASIGALVAYALFMYLLFFKYALKEVNPIQYASKSTLYENLSVLVGGETLSNLPKDFPFDIAKKEWKVPPDVDYVIIDLDNILNDDYAKWALSVADEAIVPMSLSTFDFDRLCTDPRNGALFEVLEQMGRSAPRISSIVFNRLRVHASYSEDDENPNDHEFKLSRDEDDLLEAINKMIESRIGDRHSVSLMREMPPGIIASMLNESVPVDKIKKNNNNRKTLENSIQNLEHIVDKVFA